MQGLIRLVFSAPQTIHYASESDSASALTVPVLLQAGHQAVWQRLMLTSTWWLNTHAVKQT